MRTFSVDPEKRTGRLPVIEHAAFKEPLCGSLVTDSTRNLWFVDGSCGESHFRRFSRNWFPITTHEASDLRGSTDETRR